MVAIISLILLTSIQAFELHGFTWQHKNPIEVQCEKSILKEAKTVLKEWSKATGLKFKIVKVVDSGILIKRGLTLPYIGVAGVQRIGHRVWQATVVLSDEVAFSKPHARNILRHEIGHALGANHSANPDSVMHPTVPQQFDKKLSSEDLAAAKLLNKF